MFPTKVECLGKRHGEKLPAVKPDIKAKLTTKLIEIVSQAIKYSTGTLTVLPAYLRDCPILTMTPDSP